MGEIDTLRASIELLHNRLQADEFPAGMCRIPPAEEIAIRIEDFTQSAVFVRVYWHMPGYGSAGSRDVTLALNTLRKLGTTELIDALTRAIQTALWALYREGVDVCENEARALNAKIDRWQVSAEQDYRPPFAVPEDYDAG